MLHRDVQEQRRRLMESWQPSKRGAREAASRRRFLVAIAGAVIAGTAVGAAMLFKSMAGEAAQPINTIGSDGIAIRGYDPVAYFRDGGPRAGKEEHSLRHAGVTWRFASAENKAAFAADPDRFTPAYGGYCAYGVAKGGLYKIEPDAWSIRDGRLYLNYDRSVQAAWAKQPGHFIATADRKWPALVKK
jgi:YHS domain-containing protein